jgi:hypothetical protein
LWGGAILLWFLSSDLSLVGFVDHGEFAIYSAALLAPALFILLHEYRPAFPDRTAWGLATIACLVLAVLMFAAASAPQAARDAPFEINRVALRVVTTLLYAASLALAFALVVVRETLASEPSLDELDSTGPLERRFDQLKG